MHDSAAETTPKDSPKKHGQQVSSGGGWIPTKANVTPCRARLAIAAWCSRVPPPAVSQHARPSAASYLPPPCPSPQLCTLQVELAGYRITGSSPKGTPQLPGALAPAVDTSARSKLPFEPLSLTFKVWHTVCTAGSGTQQIQPVAEK